MKHKVNVLVTGADGQLGLTIKDIAEAYPNINFSFKTAFELDITDRKSIRGNIRESNYDYIINCAAYTNVDQAEEKPELAFKVNAEGVKELALACKENGIILVHVSTDYVFDGEKKAPYSPTDLPNPLNEYGKSKLAGEIHVQEILKKHFIVRTSWLYSKKHGNNFYKTILSNSTLGDLSVIDGEIGCPTDTVNLAKYLLKLIDKKMTNYGILHFCDGEAMSWYDFAKLILTENDLQGRVELTKRQNRTYKARRPKYSVLETSPLS